MAAANELPPLPPGVRLAPDYEVQLLEFRAAAAGFGGPLGVVLGSGLGDAISELEIRARLPFEELPGFHAPSVAAHSGELLQCRLGDGDLVAMSGRLHAYEGLSMGDVVFPAAALWALGARAVLLTNAAGGLRPGWRAGDFMLIDGLIDLHLDDPLRGIVSMESPGAPGRTIAAGTPMDPELRMRIARSDTARTLGAKQGCYASVWGPHYETPAEIGMLRRLGADAVGMSTGPESALLHRLGVRVAGISCITNVAVETGGESVSHEEVVEVGQARRDAMGALVLDALRSMAAEVDA